MRIYTFSDNSHKTRGTPWLREAIVEYKRIDQVCDACGRIRTFPEGVIKLIPELGKGSFWPDIIGCGSGGLGCQIVSESLIQGLKAAGIDPGYTCQAEIEPPLPKILRETHPPKYYHLDPPVGAIMDYEKSGYEIIKRCEVCQHAFPSIDNHGHGYRLVEGSWNGSDLFRVYAAGYPFCTERIIHLAHLHQWTNIRFVPIEQENPSKHKGIKYLSKNYRSELAEPTVDWSWMRRR